MSEHIIAWRVYTGHSVTRCPFFTLLLAPLSRQATVDRVNRPSRILSNCLDTVHNTRVNGCLLYMLGARDAASLRRAGDPGAACGRFGLLTPLPPHGATTARGACQ